MIDQNLVSSCAHEIARFCLSDGYVTSARDQGWDPERYEFLPGDLEFLQGKHADDISRRAGLVPDDEREAFEDAVLREVRVNLADAVKEA